MWASVTTSLIVAQTTAPGLGWAGGQELQGPPQAVGDRQWLIQGSEPHPALGASTFWGRWAPPAMTANPGQALSALLLTLLLGLTGEPEHCPWRPSEWAGITQPATLPEGRLS